MSGIQIAVNICCAAFGALISWAVIEYISRKRYRQWLATVQAAIDREIAARRAAAAAQNPQTLSEYLSEKEPTLPIARIKPVKPS